VVYLDGTGVLRHGPPCGTYPPGPPVDLSHEVEAVRRAFPTMAVVLTPREVVYRLLRDCHVNPLSAWLAAKRLDRAGLLARNEELLFPWRI
jgi:hypothetical protein